MAIVSAVAGPFDVGTVVTRFALDIDPRTAEVSVDGAASDPLPHILAGIPLRVRDIQADVDRPGFTLNPTSPHPHDLHPRAIRGKELPPGAASAPPSPKSPTCRPAKVLVDMQGGKKGLIVNSTNLCAKKHRANVRLDAHSAKQRTITPVMQAACAKRG